jgi:hypothetical protein
MQEASDLTGAAERTETEGLSPEEGRETPSGSPAEKESRAKLCGLFRDSVESFLSSPESLERFSRFAARLVISPSEHISGKLFTWDDDLMQEAGKKVVDLIKLYASKSDSVTAGPETGGGQTDAPEAALNAGGAEIGLLPDPPRGIAPDTSLEPAVKKPDTGFLSLFLNAFLEREGKQTIARILAIDEEQKARIDTFVCGGILKIVDEQIAGVLSTINIRSLVSERIDSLDMIRVERIILDVMANQLKWINLFGAILGALIGLFQALFSWFLRV